MDNVIKFNDKRIEKIVQKLSKLGIGYHRIEAVISGVKDEEKIYEILNKTYKDSI